MAVDFRETATGQGCAATELSNDDVRWDGTYVGLTPTVIGPAAERITAASEADIPELLRALASPDKFAVAHVLLTKVSGVEYQASPAWNGLVVSIGPDGAVSIDPSQRFELAARWERWYASKPRPARIPDAT